MSSPTPEQLQAINHEGGNLLILACAGSGKTETLAQRIASMVKRGADRASIVAFTFTDHAADELKYRVRAKLEEAVPDEPSLGDMYVGTIHSFCLRVLRERKPEYRRYEVMDETRQAALIAANFVRFDKAGIGLDRLRSRTRSNTYSETLKRFVNSLNVIHQQQIDIEEIDDPVLAEAVQNYRDIAYGSPNYFFDFNNIIDSLIEFLEKTPEELSDIRLKLTHVFVDEYQDVDDRQERLIRLLTNTGKGPRITVVGDDDQALYGFRGASVKNILSFKGRYPDVTQVTLSANFRSTHAIVSISDEAVRKISGRIPKEPVARKVVNGGKLEERMAERGDIQLQTFASEENEASWVAERIQELRGVEFEEADRSTRGLDYGDMAILLRSVKGAGAIFADTLRSRDIPVVISGTRGLFNNDEIRVIQASFSLLVRAELAAPDAYGRMRLHSTVETRQIIRDKIARLRETGRLGEYANSTHYLSWLDKKRAELDERALSKEERKPSKGTRIYPQDIYHELLRELGACKDKWPVDVMFNFGAFSKLLTKFESVHQWITPSRLKNLSLFLSNWAAENVDEGGISELAGLNSVKVMTIHAAKGLEWPVVFLPRITSMIFPSNLRSRGPDTFLPKKSFDPTPYIGGDDGERRLWYVALTRCAKFLHVSSLDRPRKRPTSYFSEIHHDFISRDGSDPTSRREIDPQPPTNAKLLPTTYSDLAAFWRCEYEYQLRSLMHFSPGVGEQFDYGKQLHNMLAEIHQKAIAGYVIDGSEIGALVEKRFHLRYTRGKPFELMREAAIKGLGRYVEKYGSRLLDARAVEKPFELIDKESGALIGGVVDLLEKGDIDTPPSKKEIIGLVDFKARSIKEREQYNEIKESVKDQLQLYALGVRYAFSHEPGHAAAYVISHKDFPDELTKEGWTERIPIDVSTTAREEAREKVSTTVKQIRERLASHKFSRTGVEHHKCGDCDFRTFCKGVDEFKRHHGSSIKGKTPEEDRVEEVDRLMEEVGGRFITEL